MKDTAGFNSELVRKTASAASAFEQMASWDATTPRPRVALVLGSGLGAFCEALTDRRIIPYGEVPHMPVSAVPGHAGRWVIGSTGEGTRVLVAEGRVHGYEGHDPAVVTLPVRIMAKLGVRRLILTNAAGSVNPAFRPGDFVLLDDHINLTGHSPLTGIFAPELGARFTDMSEPYERKLNDALIVACREEKSGIRLHRGVYAGLSGPQYETPAEVKMLARLGADVVGMSTVHEAIVAKQCNLTVNAVSCVTNLGSGLCDHPLSHEEVAEAGRRSAGDFSWLVSRMAGLAAR